MTVEYQVKLANYVLRDAIMSETVHNTTKVTITVSYCESAGQADSQVVFRV